ncbi:MAG: hypothetical protein ACXQT4_04535 [Methanotrichaceae archaeon]
MSCAMAQFGSKVESGDTDMNDALVDFSAPLAPNLGYWDVGPNPDIYDDDDVIYLDIANNARVDANDIRLTACGNNAAGTKVRAADNDINKPLLSLPGTAAGIYFTNLQGSTGYDALDPVYILATASDFFSARTETNDIRLNEVDGLAAGTKVLNYQPDHDMPAVAMLVPFPVVSPGGPIATIRFHNANGNVGLDGKPIYDYYDSVYIDISPTGTTGAVTPNDVRLSAPLTAPADPPSRPTCRYY